MGPQNSATRDAMLDAAEKVVAEEGYPALTARRVAEVAGFKHQLVYYYFHTMDDLVKATFQRRAETTLEKVEAAVKAPKPLHALWEIYSGINARLALEMTAYSAQKPELGAEHRKHLQRSHDLQEPVIAKILEANGIDRRICPPVVAVMLMRALTQFLERETALGSARGGAEMQAFVEWALSRLDLPSPAQASPAPKE
jgi:AcrR family transcriptional regulator